MARRIGRGLLIYSAIVLAATVALLIYGARQANRARINLQTRTRRR